MTSIATAVRHRPALVSGAATALVAGIALVPFMPGATASLVAWDLGVVAYAAVMAAVLRRSDADSMRRRALALDQGAWGILCTATLAALASLVAIVVELAQAKGTPHAGASASLALATVLLSWAFVHAVYAVHYAHEHYRGPGGLDFPGNKEPDLGEFFYFSFCIGVASQTADVATQGPGIRRAVLLHSILSFLFNASVLALGINVAASLMG